MASRSSTSSQTISPVFAPQLTMNSKDDAPAMLDQLRRFMDKEFLPRTLKALRQAKTQGAI